MRLQSAESSGSPLLRLRSQLEGGADPRGIDPRLVAAARSEAAQRAALQRSWGEGGAAEASPAAEGWGEGGDARLAAYRRAAARGGEGAAFEEADAGRAEDPRFAAARERASESGAGPSPDFDRAGLQNAGRSAETSGEQADLAARLKRLRDEIYAPRPMLESDYASRALSDGARAAGAGAMEAGEDDVESAREIRALDDVGRPAPPPRSGGEAQPAQAGRAAPQAANVEGVERYAAEPQQGSLAAHLKRLREEVYNGGVHPSDAGRPAPELQAAQSAAPAQQSAAPAQAAQPPQQPQPDPSRWAAESYAQPEPQPQRAEEPRQAGGPILGAINAFLSPFLSAKSAFFGGLSSLFGGGAGRSGGQGADPRAAQTQNQGRKAEQEAGQPLEAAPLNHLLNT